MTGRRSFTIVKICTRVLAFRKGPRERLLKRMLDCLNARGVVHGDFRMANVILKPGEEKRLCFDWAGEVGTVRYPTHPQRWLWLSWRVAYWRGGQSSAL